MTREKEFSLELLAEGRLLLTAYRTPLGGRNSRKIANLAMSYMNWRERHCGALIEEVERLRGINRIYNQTPSHEDTMKNIGFAYAISLELEFSGAELNLMRLCSKRHYDGACKSASKMGGFIYGMVNQFIGHVEHEANNFHILDHFLEEKTQEDEKTADWEAHTAFLQQYGDTTMSFVLASRKLDTLNKILETLQMMFASGVDIETEEEKTLASGLWLHCKQALNAGSDEWRRVTDLEEGRRENAKEK